MKSKIYLILILILLAWLAGSAQAQTNTTDFYPPDILDKPLGIERLPDGHTLITDAGGAHYTTTDESVIEVDTTGQIVWQFVGDMAFPHSAERLPDGTTLITDTGHDRLLQVDSQAQIVWTSDGWEDGTGMLSDGSHLDYPNDAELLDNGHLLITDRNNDRVIETTWTGEVVWTYADLERPHNADRLPNGNTIISDSEKDRVIEVTVDQEIVWSYGGEGKLNWPRDADRLDNGHTLITDSRNNRVIELDQAGQIVWVQPDLALPYEADRLVDGRTLISDNNRKQVVELDPDGTIAWNFRNFPDDYPATLQNSGFEQDENGNGLPDGWYPADLNAEAPVTFLWDNTVNYTGQRSGGLEYSGSGRVAWYQIVQVTPSETYHFSGRIKAEISDGAFAYQLWFVDKLGGPIGEPITVNAHGSSLDWTQDEITVSAPPDAAAIQIWAMSIARGRVWFDDIDFEPPRQLRISLIIGVAIGLVVLAGVILYLFR